MPKAVQNNNTPSAPRKRKEAASSHESGPSKKKCKKYFCSVGGCPNYVVSGGVCIRHGAKYEKKLCSVAECSNQAQNGGVCIRHGAKVKRCSVAECSNQVRNGGVCIRHGAKIKQCKVDECTNQVRWRGLCGRHRAYSENNQGGGNHSNVATAATNNYSSNFPGGWGGGQQGMGMSVLAGGFIPTIYQFSPFFGFCQPTAQSVFLQHSNALPGNQQIEPAAEISDNEDEGDTQLNSKAQSNLGGKEGKGLKRQHSLPLPIAKKKDLAPASSKEDDVERNGGDEKSQWKGFMAETDQKDDGDEPVASHRGVGPQKEFDEIAGGHNQDDESKTEGGKLNEDFEWGGDDQNEFLPVDGEVDDKSDYEKQSDVVPGEIAVDTEDGEKEEVRRLHAELNETKKQVIALEEEAARYKSSSESEKSARQSELNDLRAQLRTKELELNEKTESIAALEQKFDELNAEKEDKLQTAAMKEAALQYQVEANSGVIKDLKEQLEELAAELEEVTAEKESLQSQFFKISFAQLLGFSKKEAAIAKLEGKVKDFEETFWKQKEEWKKLHAKLSDTKSDLKEKSSSAEELKKSNKSLKIKLEFALNELAKLEIAFDEVRVRSAKSSVKRGNKNKDGKGFGSLGLLEGIKQCINGS
jgi:hypothetical protein